MRNALVLALVLGLAVSGCATMGGGTARKVDDTVDDWAEALAAKDLDAFMATYSEDYKDYEYSSKAGLASFMAESKGMGYLDDLKIDRSSETVEAEGDTAKAGPISITGYFGVITLHLKLAKEAGGWRIVGQDSYGM